MIRLRVGRPKVDDATRARVRAAVAQLDDCAETSLDVEIYLSAIRGAESSAIARRLTRAEVPTSRGLETWTADNVRARLKHLRADLRALLGMASARVERGTLTERRRATAQFDALVREAMR